MGWVARGEWWWGGTLAEWDEARGDTDTNICVALIPPPLRLSPSGLARCKYKTCLSTKKVDVGTVAYMWV